MSGSGVFAHWKNTKCNGCDKIVAHPPENPKGGRGNTGGKAFFCSPECEARQRTKDAEEPRSQFSPYTESVLGHTAGGGRRVKPKGRR